MLTVELDEPVGTKGEMRGADGRGRVTGTDCCKPGAGEKQPEKQTEDV